MEKLVKQILGKNPVPESWAWPKNWILKLLSLLFAVFLWYFVVGEDKVDMNVLIPIEIINLPHDLVITNQFKKQLDVTVSGSRGLIRGIAKQNISRTIDMSDAEPGSITVQNDLDSIPLPRGIRTMRIQPTHLTFVLDRLIHKELFIKSSITGSLPKGFELESIVLEPASISLTGPQASLGQFKSIPTHPIDISSMTKPTPIQISLDMEPAIADIIGEPIIAVQLNIKEKIIEKKISALPVEVLQPKPNTTYVLEPKTVDIMADIPYSSLRPNKEMASLFRATVSASSLLPGTHEQRVNVYFPDGMKITNIMPGTVTVKSTETKSPAKMKKKP